MLYFVQRAMALCSIGLIAAELPAADHPLSAEKRAALRKEFDQTIVEFTKRIEREPRNVGYYSRRGDAYFFRGHFQKAVADYEKMVELEPKRNTSHWRRGIAYFYAGEHKQAAHQFEIYNMFDDVDRENGIWRFFSQSKAYGVEKARKGLLKYKKDDRQPFPDVYRLFERRITAEQIISKIQAAVVDDREREKRRFYAHLYIGLNDAIENKPKSAVAHLRKSVANRWGPTAGYGPHYMWHVGRLHYNLLSTAANKTKK